MSSKLPDDFADFFQSTVQFVEPFEVFNSYLLEPLILDLRPSATYSDRHLAEAVCLPVDEYASKDVASLGEVLAGVFPSSSTKSCIIYAADVLPSQILDAARSWNQFSPSSTTSPGPLSAADIHFIFCIVAALKKYSFTEFRILNGGYHAYLKQFPFQCFSSDYEVSDDFFKEVGGLCYPQQVLPGLYVGAYITATQGTVLRNLGITKVVNCAVECDDVFAKQKSKTDPDITYCHLSLSDSPYDNLGAEVKKAIPFIRQAQQQDAGVFVHCQYGASRSAAVAICYLLLYEPERAGDTFDSCYSYLKRQRATIRMNNSYTAQIRKWAAGPRPLQLDLLEKTLGDEEEQDEEEE